MTGCGKRYGRRSVSGQKHVGLRLNSNGRSSLGVKQAKALALKEAVVMAKALELKEVIFELDKKQVVDCVLSNSCPWPICSIILEIKELIKSEQGFSFKWISKSANGAADITAKLVLNHNLPYKFCNFPFGVLPRVFCFVLALVRPWSAGCMMVVALCFALRLLHVSFGLSCLFSNE
ncbi:putative ribonuclease H-like domain-containing protein [Senna tora]|uniref:Putative ribonuclease H-like domain-containing protein n=1 Tax=Senna tora TaxID=362788 RepID=A0A834SX15_9FABA|nr:putative ribonuclease H-like domain-containing protein [Senna tora]